MTNSSTRPRDERNGKDAAGGAKESAVARARRHLRNSVAVLRSDYDQLTPYDQGFITYQQSDWNSEVPDASPYMVTSEEHRQFESGQRDAMLLSECDA